ncbi:MAG: inverse autotransporter beta domain-containing protein [Chlamydiae bacterium]|nr:inverse autotransporter beta domain-containing protein [Chlamydiota bacterium]
MLKSSLLATLVSCSTIVHANELKQNDSCPPGPKHMRASTRHIEAGGIGYNKGYTTIEAFLSSDPSLWRLMPFLDLRGHVFNDGKFASNAGIGARSIWGCRAYGINAYYDYRNTHHRNFNQVSLGLETLGTLWDVRINGYLPVGGKISSPYNPTFGRFSGNSILVNRKYQYAMKGIDGEAGFHFGKTSLFDFYGAAGPYYFKGEMGKGAIGGKARIASYFKEYITLELSDSWDNVFKNNVQGQLTLTLPFGPKSRQKATTKNCPDTCDYANTLAMRMVQPVARQEIIVIDTDKKATPANSFVLFVDNLSHSAGTFESPYATLSDAEANSKPGDIIYVFPGDGTSTGMNSGITLKEGQSLLGAGTEYSLATTLGTISIPASSSTSPVLTNTNSAPVVTLASNNIVSGLYIENTNGNGIFGANITNFTTASNYIIGGIAGDAILLNDLSGQLNISDSFFNQSALSGTSGNMIHLIQTIADCEVNLTDNTFLSQLNGSAPHIINGFTAKLSGSSSMENLMVIGCECVNGDPNHNNGAIQAYLSDNSHITNFTINNSTFDSWYGGPYASLAENASLTNFTATNCTFTNCVYSFTAGPNSSNSLQNMTAINCSFSGSEYAILNEGTGTIEKLNVQNCNFILDSEISMYGPINEWTIKNNIFTGNNLPILSIADPFTSGLIANNQFIGNYPRAIYITAQTGSSSLSIVNNVFSENSASQGYAASINTVSGSTFCLDFMNNTATPTQDGSNVPYLFTGTIGTFNLTPNSTQASNTGIIDKTGSFGSCTSN